MSTMPFQEINEIILANAIASSFSLLGVIFVILTYIFISEIRSIPTIKFVLCLSFADLILTISGLVEAAPSNENETICIMMGFLNQFGRISSLLWTSVFAYSLYNVLKTNILNQDDFHKYVTICFTIPFILSFIPLIKGWYGNATIFCWISGSLNSTEGIVVELCFYYGWFIVAVVFNTVCYTKAIALLKKNAATAESKASFYQLLFYPLILVICWSVGLVDRFEIALNNLNDPTLRVSHVFLIQIQGFLNALAYGANYAVRSAIKSKWRMLFKDGSISDLSLDISYDNANSSSFQFKESKKDLVF